MTNDMSNDVDCPYCGKGLDINHDDGYGYEEGVKHQQQCGHCDKSFVYETCISFIYDVEKADCLNGSEHEYKPTMTVPREYTKMRCSMCGDERKPTAEEMESFINSLTK